jgi:predicted NAD-dependent protein-ADP-ribosyltransferase YbiA (DUF1768 family)
MCDHWSLKDFPASTSIRGFTGEYEFLDLFTPARIVVPRTFMKGFTAPSVWHAYYEMITKRQFSDKVMAVKTREEALAFQEEIKKHVKTYKDYWGALEVMPRYPHHVYHLPMLVRQKFAYGTEYADKLLQTGIRKLINDLPYDCKELGVYKEHGSNALGTILERVRNRLQKTVDTL